MCNFKKKERERKRDRERETRMCYFTHLCVHWLILVRALNGDQAYTIGMWGWCPNKLSYPARAIGYFLNMVLFVLTKILKGNRLMKRCIHFQIFLNITDIIQWFSTAMPQELFKHATPACLVKSTDLFSLVLSSKK